MSPEGSLYATFMCRSGGLVDSGEKVVDTASTNLACHLRRFASTAFHQARRQALSLLHVSDHASPVIEASCIRYRLPAVPQTLYPQPMFWKAGIFDVDVFGKLQLSATARLAIHSGKSLHIQPYLC